MRPGEWVMRKSYGGDVTFAIHQINGRLAILKGVDVRLLADAPESDLIPVDPANLAQNVELDRKRKERSIRQFGRLRRHNEQNVRSGGKLVPHNSYFEVPGRVLHLDGDQHYLQKSMQLYKELRVPAAGYFVSEGNMAAALRRLLPELQPDIVVVTGHDGILKQRREKDIFNLSSYKNSHNFVNAVKVAREYDRSRDSLVIVAGACQSHFEALLQAGANFASSPRRVLIHALDPLYIAAKVAYTPLRETVEIADILPHTLSGLEGLGGLETRGVYRIGLPRVSWTETAASAVQESVQG
ncbi:sporulation peptidase YabG [Gorillibacterium massiliense]|uniref:sporulation peptidase YabG n=1 Tax=Gorillibacterium massiliense TaxID=1280390 RepID=UPI0004B2EE5A|nr:sporulation peptidase YabG [Gorillibacterium massiliense]